MGATIEETDYYMLHQVAPPLGSGFTVKATRFGTGDYIQNKDTKWSNLINPE